jgi:uncharacterized membrane protein
MYSQVESPARANIESVARLERKSQNQRTMRDRIAEAVAAFVGSLKFVALQVVLLVFWVAANTGRLPGIVPFDPYPFVLLALIESTVGVLLATFVLIKQNRMSRRADRRDHLHLQIDLLAEKEITKILELQRLLCARLGVQEVVADPETEELVRYTAVEDLAEELERKLPAET